MNTVTAFPSARTAAYAEPAKDPAGPALPPPVPSLSGFSRSAAHRGRGLHGQLVQQLGQMIVGGELGADRPLVPEEIGQRFDVSRTVVRESLRVLEAKGLVCARPNVGTRIRPVHEWNLLDPDVIEWRAVGPCRADQARELTELRRAFEPLAAHLVADRAAELPDSVRLRLVELAEAMSQTPDPAAPAADPSAAPSPVLADDPLGYRRADAELHALLLRATGNSMLEHLAAVVYGALEITGAPAEGCRPCAEPGADRHADLVALLLDGDGPGAAEVLSEMLGTSAVARSRSAQLPMQRGF
jgi:DNA-binding FadR family transcriptional regulator